MELSSGVIREIKKQLQGYPVSISSENNKVTFRNGDRHITFTMIAEPVISQPSISSANSESEKLASVIMSRLGLNRRIYARDCTYRAIDKSTATDFLDKFHLMKSTGSAYVRGLFYKDDLVAVASFSKGRKMRRLTPEERSYELIRFCCRQGISVSGGLSKLVKNFCREKKAGDIMSYVDARLSDGSSFIAAGFTEIKEVAPGEAYNKSEISHKLIYTCPK